ncbi:beta-galactosidase [Chitinophaga sp. MM2321]|uniref:beta-galactosidase n=1 Tax=Chitinophaga sp. MM2321 TaxID=3137178 RepID=UPI0032D5A798
MNKYIVLIVLVCLELVVKAQETERSCAAVRMKAGVPALYINDTPYPPFAYMSYLGEEKYYREAAIAGIHLYNIPAYLGDRGINSTSGIKPFRTPVWLGKNTYDYKGIIHDFEEVLRADPAAKVIIRLHLDPPVWWEKENPDAVCRLPDGSGYRTSFSSPKWQHDAGEVLREVVKWLLHSPYSAHVAGVHVAGGFTEEWFYHYKDHFYDESNARKVAFRKWLRQHYADNTDSLRHAWNDQTITFDQALPADISGTDRKREWRNAATDQRYFNTFDFQATTIADHIAYSCKIVKDASNNCLLTGAFYGYHYFVSDPRRGHGALAKLLDCPYLDYLSSPNDYNRVAGEDWAPMAAIKSVQLHGKLWLAENDTRTTLTTLLKERAPAIAPPGEWYTNGVWIGPDKMSTSVSLLRKNLARMLAYGYGGWWFDMWGGWFSDPALLAVLHEGQQYFVEYPDAACPQMKPEVAVVVDERLQEWDKDYGGLTGEITGNRYALGKTGAPYDLYLRTDLNKVSAGQYKVIWLMGIMDPNEQELTLIKKWAAKGMMVLQTDGYGTTIYFKETGTQPTFSKKLRWPASALGKLWDSAGVHRYLNTEDVVYAGRGWLSVHSVKGGKKELKLPFYAQVSDPVTKKIIAGNTKTVTLDMEPGATILLRVVPEKKQRKH